MKKEMSLAVLVGLVLGLIITYGVYRARTSLIPENQTTLAETEVNPSPSANTLLTVTSPEDEIISEEKEITVTGTTTANTFVVVFVNDEEHITTTDVSGNYSVNVSLESGSNVITVQMVTEDGTSMSEERTVIYSTTPLEETTPEATSSGETSQ